MYDNTSEMMWKYKYLDIKKAQQFQRKNSK